MGQLLRYRHDYSRHQAIHQPDVPPQVISVDETLPPRYGGVPVRRYFPDREPRGIVCFAHGGGWVFGDLDSHDGVCRSLASAAGAQVVSVDYRLAPEHPFPAAVEDVLDVLYWLAETYEPVVSAGRLALAGESAGATLMACAARQCARDGLPVSLQALVYPVVFVRGGQGAAPWETELSLDVIAWFWNQYLPDGAGDDPWATPLAGPAGPTAPALVLSGEHDPLCPESELYAGRLRAAGVPVRLARFVGLGHSWLREAATPASRRAVGLIASTLQLVWRGGTLRSPHERWPEGW